MCLYPLTAYWSKDFGSSGKRLVTFDRNRAFSGVPLRLPCYQCVECRLARSLSWAVRCMHEKQLHTESSFVTLTYDNEHLPEGGTLVMRDHQLFMKRMRKRYGKGIRFFMCGEYGERGRRPHYHYLFFNRDFGDRKFYKLSKSGERLYTSDEVSELWRSGFNVIGDVTLESCAYVARYICDKVNGDMAASHYDSVDAHGCITRLLPEFNCGSRRPGLASEWYEQFGKHSHVSGDHCVLNGKRVKMPRFYDGKYELSDPEGLQLLKKRRMNTARRYLKNQTLDRRRVREVVTLRKLKLFSRDL